MSGNELFLLLMLGHVLGSILLQPETPATRMQAPRTRHQAAPRFILPAAASLLAGFLVLLPCLTVASVWIPPVMSALWLVPDWLRNRQTKGKPDENRLPAARVWFFVSHLAPFAAAACIAHFGTRDNAFHVNALYPLLQALPGTLSSSVTVETALRWLLMVLLLGKPANLVIRELNGKGNIRQPQVPTPVPVLDMPKREPEYQNAGSLIGTLERYLIAIMLLLGQYAAIGLIFTAKSITRYDRISKDPSFAEYYLVGTLMSTLIAIITVFVLKPV